MTTLTDEEVTMISSYMENVRIPSSSDRVYKTEGMCTFTTPFSSSGLYVNMKTWNGFGYEKIAWDESRNGKNLYLHINSIKTKKLKEDQDEKVTKLAVGMSGGFSIDAFTTTTTYALKCQENEYPLPLLNCPLKVQECMDAIIAHSGNLLQDEVSAWEEKRNVSKHADTLIQIQTTLVISPDPTSWKCAECGIQDNIWLNLGDGYIGCGRANWDGTGGCGAALRHYETEGSGRFPLAVKLGTITPTEGDVYSYDPEENDMVLDPKLQQHLLHWGINLENLKKTEKSINEMQIDLNMNYEFDAITESGQDLIPCSGPGLTGICNLGNSCYMNSVFQILFSIPEFQNRYEKNQERIVKSVSMQSELANDLPLQLSKLAVALQTSTYPEPVKPYMLQHLVGKGHSEFSTRRQQDAVEYFQHVVETITRNERSCHDRWEANVDAPLSDLFQFEFQDRIECSSSHKVKYVDRGDLLLQLQIPIEAIKTSPSSKRQKIIPQVKFEDCLTRTLGVEVIDGFYSSAIQAKTQALKRIGFKSFPKYLCIQVRRYYVSSDWTPKKMEVLIPFPESLDLEQYKSNGVLAGEEELPQEGVVATSVEVADEVLVAQLVSMGFSENGCKRAALATGNSNSEAAMEWIFSHMEDDDFNTPIQETTTVSSSSPDPAHVSMLCDMGFTAPQAAHALSTTGGDIERAAEWLFSHAGDLDTIPTTSAVAADTATTSAKGQYTLHGIISHIGTSTGSGHYVAHILKNGKWVLFNDEKVAESKSPPLELGYMYIYRRNDVVV